MLTKLCVILLPVAIALLPSQVGGYPVDMDKLPNQGRNSFGCVVCHISPAGEEINIFGRDYRENNHRYNEMLMRMDSDGDGFSNDQELRASPAANPGDPRSFPWDPPDPWPWGATLAALVVAVTGGFSLVLRKSNRCS